LPRKCSDFISVFGPFATDELLVLKITDIAWFILTHILNCVTPD